MSQPDSNLSCLPFFNTIFVSSHMYPDPEGTQVIVGSMNIIVINHICNAPKKSVTGTNLKRGGYGIYIRDIWDIYPTLPGIELTTCSVPSGSRSH